MRRRSNSWTTTAPISPATRRAPTARPCTIRRRGWCWCRGSACSASGASVKEARIAADIAEAAVEGITDAEAIGRFTSIGEADTFDIDYWPLELAKLGQRKVLPLAGQIAVITGAGGAIGAATARAFARAGAAVALLDLDLKAAQEKAKGDRRRARARLRRHRSRLGQRRLRAVVAALAASISRSPTPAAPGRARSARSTKRCCAQASN